MKEKKYISKIDNYEITYYVWEVKNPKGVVHMVHGSIDHAKHYGQLANFLNKNGYSVYAMDLRGHGESVEDDKWGYFGKKDGHMKVLDDIHNINKIIKNETGDLPITLIGHSMGSFIVRAYLSIYDDIAKAIAVGTNHLDSLSTNTMIFLSHFGKKHKPAKMINRFSYIPFNKNFKHEKDKLSWISKDINNREDNKKSKYTKFIMSHESFGSMGRWIKMYKDKNTHKHKIPVLLLNGSKDPVGKDGKEVKKAYEFYKTIGFDVTHIEYENLRHEVLNENEMKVFNDILIFISGMHLDSNL